MRQRAWDQGFVAAAPDRVYAAVADPHRYGAWWSGVLVEDDGSTTLRLRRLPPLTLERERARPGTGVVFRVAGQVAGRWEWYLEPFAEGTIVNALLDLDLPGGERAGRRRLYRLRAAVRRGLVGLKGALE